MTRKKADIHYSFAVSGSTLIIKDLYPSDSGSAPVSIDLTDLHIKKRVEIPVKTDPDLLDRILWIHEMTENEFHASAAFANNEAERGYLVIFTNTDSGMMYLRMYADKSHIYKNFIRYNPDVSEDSFKADTLHFDIKGIIHTEKELDINIEKIELVIDDNNRVDVDLPPRMEKYMAISAKGSLPVSSILSRETSINNALHLDVTIDGCICSFNVGTSVESDLPEKYYYLPLSSVNTAYHVLYIRQNKNRHFIMTVRRKEPEEYDKSVMKMEEKLRSYIMYNMGRLQRRMGHVKCNLFYEKNAMKAEEGTFQLFEKIRDNYDSENYFILSRKSDQWPELSKHKNVIAKFSKEYYRLLYRADALIATETSAHMHIFRAGNYYSRKALLDKKFIFLQHGVTYMKRHDKASVITAGKEGEPDYIVVNSDKERDVVSKMLGIKKSRCIVSGMTIFDLLEHDHIKQSSDDIVVIMCTWLHTEEHMLTHFMDSTSYKKVVQIYDVIKKYIPKDRIRIVPHPKIAELMKKTDLKGSLWCGSISDALRDAKLLITDYSSTCYNVFYQGGAVLFYQPDLSEYEAKVGKLIPDDDEYIGFRTFSPEEFSKAVSAGISEKGLIDLSVFRNEEFEKRYREINEFSDGKNTDRLIQFLADHRII